MLWFQHRHFSPHRCGSALCPTSYWLPTNPSPPQTCLFLACRHPICPGDLQALTLCEHQTLGLGTVTVSTPRVQSQQPFTRTFHYACFPTWNTLMQTGRRWQHLDKRSACAGKTTQGLIYQTVMRSPHDTNINLILFTTHALCSLSVLAFGRILAGGHCQVLGAAQGSLPCGFLQLSAYSIKATGRVISFSSLRGSRL